MSVFLRKNVRAHTGFAQGPLSFQNGNLQLNFLLFQKGDTEGLEKLLKRVAKFEKRFVACLCLTRIIIQCFYC